MLLGEQAKTVHFEALDASPQAASESMGSKMPTTISTQLERIDPSKKCAAVNLSTITSSEQCNLSWIRLGPAGRKFSVGAIIALVIWAISCGVASAKDHTSVDSWQAVYSGATAVLLAVIFVTGLVRSIIDRGLLAGVCLGVPQALILAIVLSLFWPAILLGLYLYRHRLIRLMDDFAYP
jgi:hypothetical protein